MVKRIVSLGAAVALIISLTVSSFAISHDYDLSFPFYGRARIRQGGTQIYIDSNIKPISSSEAGSLSGAGGTVIFDFYPYTSTYSLEDNNQTTFYDHYTIWDISERDKQNVYYDSNGDIDYIQSPFSNFHVQSYNSTESTLDLSQYAYVTAKSVKAGSFLLEGYLEFANNAVGSLNTWLSMVDSVTGSCITASGSYSIDIPYSDFEYHKYNGHDRINYKIALTVPYSGEYERLFFQINTASESSIPSLTGFSVNTGALKFQAASDSLGFSVLVGGWFSDTISAIKSGFYNLGHLLTSNRDDAGQAAEEADTQTNTEDQSIISEVEQYESSLNSNVSSSVSQLQQNNYLDLSGTTSTYLQALGVVSYVFGAVFGTLGGHQVVITIPLVLGIVLLLVGRGSMALGRHMDLSVRAARRSKHDGGGSV